MQRTPVNGKTDAIFFQLFTKLIPGNRKLIQIQLQNVQVPRVQSIFTFLWKRHSSNVLQFIKVKIGNFAALLTKRFGSF